MTEHRSAPDWSQGLVAWSGPQRQVTYAWPAEAVAELRMDFARARTAYRARFAGSPASVRLTSSALFAEAYARSRLRRAAWLGDVRPARTGSPGGAAYKQMAFIWPVALIGLVEDDFDLLDADSATLWEPGFRLTKAHMALAVIQHGLTSRDAWLHSLPNDPRLTQ